LEREAAFWLVSEMFIFISAKMLPPPKKKIGAGVLGGLLKKKEKWLSIVMFNQIQYRFLLLKRPELHYLEIMNSPVLKYTFLHVLRFINKFNYIVKCRIQSRYFVRKRKKEELPAYRTFIMLNF
jgi:hypothetical protein